MILEAVLHLLVSRNGLLFRLNISRRAKLNSLLFLVTLRDSVRSQAKIVFVVRKTFGTTIKLHLGVGSVVFSLVKSIFTGVPQGKIDHRCAPSEMITIQKLIIHMCRIRTTSYLEAAITSDEAARSLALSL